MKKAKTPTLVITSILTLITILFWAGFEVYRTLTTKPVPTVPEIVVKPIDPILDQKSLDSLPQRLFINDAEIGNVAAATSTPVPTASPSPVASPSAIPSPSATP